MSYAKPLPKSAEVEPSNPLGVVSLVLSLVGIFTGCPIAIAGVVTGWVAMKREPNGMAKAGFAIGLVVTVLHSIVTLLLLLMILGYAVAVPMQAPVAEPPYAIELPTGYSEEVQYLPPGPESLESASMIESPAEPAAGAPAVGAAPTETTEAAPDEASAP